VALDQQQFFYARAYLRRTKTVDQLNSLADTVAQAILSGEDHVVITQNSFEGGSAAGQLRFPADVIGAAIEDLLAELDPTGSVNPEQTVGSGSYADFSGFRLTV
jgi:hypothetical protein